MSAEGSAATEATSISRKSSPNKAISTKKDKKSTKTKSPSVLSQEECDELVIEFRVKARKLGRSILRKWHARIDLEELDSVVDLSLVEAVRRFDPTKGASFMTFLYYHLRGNLIRAVSAAASAHVIPNGTPDRVDENDTDNWKDRFEGINAMEIAEALVGNDAPLPDDVLFKKQLISLSADACTKLDALEQEVIYRIFMKEQQLMDIANSLGYSRCHISRVKKKALDVLHDQMCGAVSNEDDIPVEAVKENGFDRNDLSGRGRREIHRRRPRSTKVVKKIEKVQPQKRFTALAS